MELLPWLGKQKNIEPTDLSPEKTLGDKLAENHTSFPYQLLKDEEERKIDTQIRGTASVTAGGVILSPWQCISDERATELLEQVQRLQNVTNGLFQP